MYTCGVSLFFFEEKRSAWDRCHIGDMGDIGDNGDIGDGQSDLTPYRYTPEAAIHSS